MADKALDLTDFSIRSKSANTLIQASLVGDQHLVEMEAEAIVMKAGENGD